MNAYVERVRELSRRVADRQIRLPKKRGQIEAQMAPLLPPIAMAADDDRIKVPTQAFSEFLINREMGDWAEDLVADEISRVGCGFSGCRYGRSENLVAGDAGFAEFYRNYICELRSLGKRPDILLYHGDAPDPEVFEDVKSDDAKAAARAACAAFEVRSSQQSLLDGRDPRALSFTPKVEDIHNVVRWIENHGVPHFYVQVLFGGVYALSFERLLRILAEGQPKVDFRVESAEKSQFKPTYYVPLTAGLRLSAEPERFEMPTLTAFDKRLSNGRMLFGVRFSGGRAPFDAAALGRLLTESRD